MRVALIASGFADYSLELAGALSETGAVLVLADAGALLRERAGAPAPVDVEVRTFSQTSLLHRWRAPAHLAASLARWRPDIILAHEHPHPHITLLLTLARRIAPLGLIVHDPKPHPGRDHDFARRHSREIAGQRAQADLLLTHEGCTEALERGDRQRAVPLVHGPILRPAGAPGAPPGDRRVLMFGRMEAYKGLEVLIQAAQRLDERGAKVALDVRGAGPELDRLKEGFAGLASCEVHPGYASRDDLLAALAACDVVVAPYLQASGSGVAAAALANHRGLVASATGGLEAAVQPGVNGVLVPPGDAEALAAGLLEALDQAARLSRGAQALATGPLAWRCAADTITAAFEDHGRRGRAA